MKKVLGVVLLTAALAGCDRRRPCTEAARGRGKHHYVIRQVVLQGDARRAVDDYLVRALVLYKRSGNRFGEGETVNAMGIGYARLGQHADAEEQYRKAVELRRTVGNRRGLATSLRNLGSALSQRGEFADATTHLQQARQLHEALLCAKGL